MTRPKFLEVRRASLRVMARRLPRLGVLAGRDDRSGTTGSDCLVALAGIVCAICPHGTDLFVGRDLVEQFRQDGPITYIASRDLDGPDLRRSTRLRA